MKVSNIVSVQLVDDNFDVTLKTSTGNYAIAHCDSNFVIQSVSRVEKQPNGSFVVVEQYSVIPQPCRVAIEPLKKDVDILNALLMEGVWHNKSAI